MRIFRKLAQLLDVDLTSTPPADGDALTYDTGSSKWVPAAGGGGAPTTAAYLVGAADGGLSAEIVVGTSPGGELGGTWASPTVDAVHSGSSHATVQAAAEATAASALSTHSSDTTGVHGIADTSALLDTGDIGSTVPAIAAFNDHSARHEDGGADEISIAGLSGTSAALQAHLDDTVDAHDASAVSFTPTGTIAATDVQAAIAEVASEAGGGGAPTDATYITQTANGSLSAEQALSALATGIVKVTTGTGVLSTATSNTDYAAATHASRHASGGADSIKLDDLAAPDDNTDLNVSTSAHGLTPKLPNDATKYLDGTGAYAVPSSELDYVEFTSNVTVSATTEATANTVVTGNSKSYSGSTVVIIEFFCGAAQPNTGGGIQIVLYEDGSSIGFMGFIQPVGTSNTMPVLLRRRMTPASGSHTYSIRAYRTTANGTLAAQAAGAGNNAPGYIRITRI